MSAAASALWQSDLVACLLEPERAVPVGLRAPGGADPARRLAVHRNNVVAGLVSALAEGFPIVRRLVGAAFFAAMAAEFVRAQPPRSPVLAEYGDGFADWIGRFAPAAPLPYLADVARLERARVLAFHAADAQALDRVAIATQLTDAAGLPAARPQLHPSCRVLLSDHAVATIWAAHQAVADEALAPIATDSPEAAVVLRDPADDVLVIPIAHAAGVFCRALHTGATLGEAASAAAAITDGFDPTDALSLLIRHGAIVAWHRPGASR